MSALFLAIKKLIAVLTAFFIPTATAAPAIVPQHSRTVTVSIFENFREDENEAPYVEEGEELEPVAEWDVSATENDNVTMAFYDTEDTASVIEQLAGRVTALFAPMTAYAADLDFTTGTTVSFKADDEAMGGDIQFGRNAENENVPVTGTIVISGKGYMMEEIYNCLIDPDLYVEEIVRLFEKVEGLNVTPIIDGEYEDLIELDANIKWEVTDEVTGAKSYAEITDAMNEALNPQAVLKYSPKEVVIADGVKNVSDFAFMMCKDLTTVHISSNIKEIGMGAFAYCTSLETVTFDEGVRTIGESAFAYCTNLHDIVLPASIRNIDSYAFEGIKEGTTITCPNDTVRAMFAEGSIALDDVIIL